MISRIHCLATLKRSGVLMLKISKFTPFKYPHDIKAHRHKKGEGYSQQSASFSACPAFGAAWELCGTVAVVSPVHSQHPSNADM